MPIKSPGGPFTWDPDTGRYRGAAGRFVPAPDVRAAVDAVIAGSTDRIAALGDRLARGTLDLGTWQARMAAELKALHLAQLAAGAGGWAALTATEWGHAGQALRTQYAYLARFAAAIAAGQQARAGVAARAALYAAAARGTFAAARGRAMARAGMVQERNLRHVLDSCPGCLEATARGWVALGTLVPVGARDCQARCRCELAYR